MILTKISVRMEKRRELKALKTKLNNEEVRLWAMNRSIKRYEKEGSDYSKLMISYIEIKKEKVEKRRKKILELIDMTKRK